MTETPLKKILVVDDEEEVLTHLTNILQRANYEVASTTKGKEALELAKDFQPDLIILDIILLDMDGKEVALILSRSPSTANVPIIFLTGFIAKEEEFIAGSITKLYTMAKPISEEELLELVDRVLRS